jgi:hypothetical protein
MLKSFWQITLRFVALTILAIAVTFSNPIFAQINPAPKVTYPSSPELRGNKEKAIICPEGTPERNEESVKTRAGVPCIQTPKNQESLPENPYDMEAIHKFDRELYGD